MKFSIIMPVYNDEKYLEDSLNSVLKQTYLDFEVICVNDASTDGCVDILHRYKNLDMRIRIIELEQNSGTSKARKEGVLSSRGDYILFLDADDILMPDACEKLDKIISKTPADIVHFRMLVHGCDGMPENNVKGMQNALEPMLGEQGILEVRRKCFEEGKLSHTLCGKLYNGTVCRKAFSYISDERYVMTEDLYASFAIIELSNSYIGINESLYQYNYGFGITSRNKTPLELLELQCSRALIISACEEIAYKIGGDALCYVDGIRKFIIRCCVNEAISSIKDLDVCEEESIWRIFTNYMKKEDASYMVVLLIQKLNEVRKLRDDKKWVVPYEKLTKGSRVILYGAGRVGQDYYNQLIQTGYCEVVAWLDKTLKADSGFEVKITLPDTISKYSYDNVLIAIKDKQIQENVKMNLISLGVKEECIIY